MNYQPHVDDYRIEETSRFDDGKHWLWQFEIDGIWLFKGALTKDEVTSFVTEKQLLASDEKQSYWR